MKPWLKDLLSVIENRSAIELAARAAKIPLDARDWEIQYGGVLLVLNHVERAVFAAAVAEVATILGPPDEVKGDVSLYRATPQLEAHWPKAFPDTRGGTCAVCITAYTTDCKLIEVEEDVPASPAFTRTVKKLHPDCVAAISELEDS